MRIHINVPVFSSPSQAFGNASGEIELPALPDSEQPFPWPSEWVQAKPAYFAQDQSGIIGMGEVNGLPLVVLDGIVCYSLEEARGCASFLESEGGLIFDEYERS